ncbi:MULTISPECIES: DUF4912 domain-containing protein [unclassified Paenibacillus]|uniref:DUF4912 domain-containing protein n=1 Tax=unclassified Paenibacillus TaxID=185978 RepID=UPI0027D79D99|nr:MULTISPECIES: DUF4912 domain-containing protein [unclassified Paenibacillus]
MDRDTLHLLIQSPTVLFTYWQLSSRKKNMVQEHFDTDWQSLQPTLRFYHVTDLPIDSHQADSVSELLLPQGESCFVSGFHPGQSYFADLGILNEQGQFLPLLRSNTIQTPPIDTNQDYPSHQITNDQLVTYRPIAVSFQLMTPEPNEHFSAYSVYSPKTAYSADTESGGDTD